MLAESGRVEQRDKAFDADVSGDKYVNVLFTRLIAKDRKFTKVDFKYTIFDACYLRKCVFDSCDFTGCRFISSNLHGSKFSGCKFDYATFEKTLVDGDLLESGCPGPENLKARFARSLRINYQKIGDAKSANKAIGIELQATEIHLYKAWNSKESYYRDKYRGWDRAKAFFGWIEFRLLDFIWGNGESAIKLLRSVFVAILAMAAIEVLFYRDPNSVRDYVDALTSAPAVLFGIATPIHYPPAYLTLILVTRLIAFAFFISIVIKRFNRR